MNEPKEEFKDIFGKKLYDVEHALSMYALSFYRFPAKSIYDDSLLENYGEGLRKCHIYLIGKVPKVELQSSRQEKQIMIVEFLFKGKKCDVRIEIPKGLTLHNDDKFLYFIDQKGNLYSPPSAQLIEAFGKQHGKLEFNVLYIGQAYGKNGSRNALDRLRKHETLQKIALKDISEGYELEVLLLEIEPSNRIFTVFNPFAQDSSKSEERIHNGLHKLFDTNKAERITLYEATLIRYFQPLYNKEFKNSFPSTNMKVLADCYDKDFSAVVAEICFDDPPYLLYSDVVGPQSHHIVKHDLHEDESREAFFGGI